MCFHFHFWLMVILASSKTTKANKGMLAPPGSARERGKASEYQIHDLLPFWRGDNQEAPLGPPGSSCKLKIKCGSCETSLPVICFPRDGGKDRHAWQNIPGAHCFPGLRFPCGAAPTRPVVLNFEAALESPQTLLRYRMLGPTPGV